MLNLCFISCISYACCCCQSSDLLCHTYVTAENLQLVSTSIGVVLLVAIALNEVDDVRPVLEFYSQFDDPIAAFREKQRQLQVTLYFTLVLLLPRLHLLEFK